jgi:hypothetical protein
MPDQPSPGPTPGPNLYQTPIDVVTQPDRPFHAKRYNRKGSKVKDVEPCDHLELSTTGVSPSHRALIDQ